MIRRVLIDLDDTLNALTMSILSRFNCGVGCHDYHRFPVECGYDIIGAYMKLHPDPGFKPPSVPDFWNRVTRDMWSKTPKSPQFDMILDAALSAVEPKYICILTSPTKDPECLAGKLEWIHEFLPECLQRQYLIGPRKYFCARGDALLIDDSDENVNTFRAEGGQAILVPRPWNTLHAVDTNTYLNDALTSFLVEHTFA